MPCLEEFVAYSIYLLAQPWWQVFCHQRVYWDCLEDRFYPNESHTPSHQRAVAWWQFAGDCTMDWNLALGIFFVVSGKPKYLIGKS
jgi:hypothetical protein